MKLGMRYILITGQYSGWSHSLASARAFNINQAKRMARKAASHCPVSVFDCDKRAVVFIAGGIGPMVETAELMVEACVERMKAARKAGAMTAEAHWGRCKITAEEEFHWLREINEEPGVEWDLDEGFSVPVPQPEIKTMRLLRMRTRINA